MTLERLRKKARANLLEVEDILSAAKKRLPGLRQELQRLAAEYSWAWTPFPPEGGHVVPLARWADIAGIYAEGGIAGLTAAADDPQNHIYIIALLEELETAEAAQALFDLFGANLAAPSWDNDVTRRLIAALNLLFSLSKTVSPTAEQAATTRSCLMALYPAAVTNDHRSDVICTLRGVGDASSVAFLSSLDPLPYPYEGIEGRALRAIRKRLRAAAAE